MVWDVVAVVVVDVIMMELVGTQETDGKKSEFELAGRSSAVFCLYEEDASGWDGWNGQRRRSRVTRATD